MIEQSLIPSTVAKLRDTIKTLQCGQPGSDPAVVSTGSSALDQLFPWHGVRRGGLVEWVGQNEASGAGTLALRIAWNLCPPKHVLIVIDPQRHVFPQALSALGMDLERVVIVHPPGGRDTLWACEESLRCAGPQVVWAEINDLSEFAFQRLRLACEASQSIGVLARPPQALKQPTWAEVRLLVRPRLTTGWQAGFHIETVYCQGVGTTSQTDVLLTSNGQIIHESL